MTTKTQPTKKTNMANRFEIEFAQIVGAIPRFDPEYRSSLEPYLNYLSTKKVLPFDERKKSFFALINKKFDLNSEKIATLYAKAANLGYTFNFHQKKLIQRAYDINDIGLLNAVFSEHNINERFIKYLHDLFLPVSDKETIEYISNEFEDPSKLRISKEGRDIKNEILTALFSSFLWVSLSPQEMHEYFDPNHDKKNYKSTFWDQLHSRYPKLFNRDHTLHIVKIDHKNFISNSSEEVYNKDNIINIVSNAYEYVNNYGFLAVIIDKMQDRHGKYLQWEIASDFILAGEKFKEELLEKNFFQWEKIKKETLDYIENIPKDVRFDLVNEGFSYRDTFVLADKENSVEKIMLVLQKNERDETKIPCPVCRTLNIQGNSYSSLGVKSWECNNLLCPDRSKYNRGKRYSFKALLMQRAIEDTNTIPVESVKRWRRDVVTDVTDEEIGTMLLRHYSMYGDNIHVYNWPIELSVHLGRKISYHRLDLKPRKNSFFNSHFFLRYAFSKKKLPTPTENLGDSKFQLYQGDAASILRSFNENLFDGAVTSPPYFNAREYSQWPNIYCYLHDMFDINKEVFRTLKPGALYLYNIFDYFDNEKTVALSAMGQKRMILSAYTVDIFRRIGFNTVGNIVWDKGDIEGKRGFNAGNFSPFYQSPFNCWEHILVFQKPIQNRKNDHIVGRILEISKKIFSCKPVLKIIKGENTHGHSAPFPEALPQILISVLPKGSTILDPFSGSLTTGRVAEREGINSVNLELLREYCELGLAKRNENNSFINPNKVLSKV